MNLQSMDDKRYEDLITYYILQFVLQNESTRTNICPRVHYKSSNDNINAYKGFCNYIIQHITLNYAITNSYNHKTLEFTNVQKPKA